MGLKDYEVRWINGLKSFRLSVIVYKQLTKDKKRYTAPNELQKILKRNFLITMQKLNFY
jgi:hypothetical protein